MRIGLLAAAAAVIALSAGSQAFAGDASCLWNHLPLEKRETMLADYQTLQIKALDPQGRFGAEAITKAVRGCHVSDEGAEAATLSLQAYIFQTASEKWLADNAQLSAATLDTAWAGFDPATKRRLVDAVGDNSIGKALDIATLNAFEAKLGRAPTAAGLHAGTPGFNLIIYMLGRTKRAAYEPKF